MSGWVQNVHTHHPGEPHWLSQRLFRPSGRQNGRLAAAAPQMCDWWPTNDKRTEERKKKQRALLLLERHCELLHLQRKWTFNRPTHTPTHAYTRTLAGAHTYRTHTEMMFFCVGSSCDGGDARQQWHFCCHKQFRFHNRKNQIQTEACQQLSEGPIYFIVNDTCPQITVCDKCSAVQPKASRAQVAFNNFILSLGGASFSLTHTREGVINILCLWLHN